MRPAGAAGDGAPREVQKLAQSAGTTVGSRDAGDGGGRKKKAPFPDLADLPGVDLPVEASRRLFNSAGRWALRGTTRSAIKDPANQGSST